MKKKKSIKDLSVEELKSQLLSEKESLKRLKLSHAVSPIENPSQIRESRRLIAKLNTELHAKQK
ncbi:MAG: 50S ribosomal protein L29 [Cytophagaceae bacterium]|jgi:large subunit ribosomal protein L29|nr:50S ribosomal protein L29 [Cytophagaceae bacterium]